MKQLVRLPLIFALTISPSLCLLGQDAPIAAPQRRQVPSTTLSQRLALTHDQRRQFRAITQERKAQVEAVKADAALPKPQRMHKLREINAEAETKIRSLLTPMQLEEYDRIKHERREMAQIKREAVVPAPTGNNPPE